MDRKFVELDEGWATNDSLFFKPLFAVLEEGGNLRRCDGALGLTEWGEIYTTVYKMCKQKPPCAYAPDLYEKVQETLRTYLRDNALPALHSLRVEKMLQEFGRRWENHKRMVKWATRVFSAIDRYYVKRHEKPNLETAGYACFKDEVFSAVSENLRTAALIMVQKERDGDIIDRSLLKKVLGIFAEMGYTREWEEFFLKATAQFYRRTSAQWPAEASFLEFIKKAGKYINEEIERGALYLNPQTQDRLLMVCKQEILIVHQQQIMDKNPSELVDLLRQNRRDELQRLCRLYRRVPEGLIPVGNVLKLYIQKVGMELVREQRSRIDAANKAQAKEKKETNTAQQTEAGQAAYNAVLGNKPDFIQSLLALHDCYSDIVMNCFDNQPVFNKAMTDAFERFVNEQVGEISTAQLFANYCDSLLNINAIGAKMSENEVEEQLDKLTKLFTYLSAKDAFLEFYRKHLAKRLLHDKSHTDEAERFFVEKMKQVVGFHAISKLEGMITDIPRSKDTQHNFVLWNAEKNGAEPDSESSQSTPGVVTVEETEFSVRVLTTGHWPSFVETKIILPPKLETCTRLFNEYYHQRNSPRSLRWMHVLGKAVLETLLFVKSGKMEMMVSILQLCVLMLFNDKDKLTYSEVFEKIVMQQDGSSSLLSKSGTSACEASGGEDAVKAALVSMMSKKVPLLIEEPKGRDFPRNSTFRLNVGYTSSRRKISIPTPTDNG